MKKRGLIAAIVILVTLICSGVLMPSHAQNVTIEKSKLVELTKLAEKSRLYEGENTGLIVENYKLKQKLIEKESELAKVNDDIKALESVRNKLTMGMVGIGVLVLLIIAAKVFKPKWL